MSTKARLISTISAVCLILALLVTGVWAVSTANITLGGTISFKADNVHATVTGTITGTQETITLPDLEYKADTDTTSTAFQSNVEKWSNNELTFTSENLITMTITVTNLSTERSLYVKVTDNTTTSNINKTFTNTANVESGKEYELVAEGSITYTMTMKVDKLDLSAEATYAYDVDLRDANAEYAPPASDFPYFTFEYWEMESHSTANITACTNDVEEVILPGKVQYDGKIYNVQCETGIIAGTVIKKLTITEGWDGMMIQQFYGLKNLEYVELNVEKITIGAFQNCSNLKTVVLNNSTPCTVVEDSFANTHADLKIFVPAESLETYKTASGWSTYADKICVIGENGEIVRPASEYSYLTFEYWEMESHSIANITSCTNDIEEMILPGKVQYDGKIYNVQQSESQIVGGGKVKKLIITEGWTGMITTMFGGFSNLEWVEIPDNYIAAAAFMGCSNLKTVVIRASMPGTVYEDSFSGTHADLKIYVPDESVETYKTASGWTVYADKIHSINDLAE